MTERCAISLLVSSAVQIMLLSGVICASYDG